MTRGFTLIEIAVVVAIIGILSAMAGVRYVGYVEKARVARVITEMRTIANTLDVLALEGKELPDALSEIGEDSARDPWDNPYRYLRIEGRLPKGMADASDEGLPPVAAPPSGGGKPSGVGKPSGGSWGAPPEKGGGKSAISEARKDHFLVPINSDYDLYSMGPDGVSKPPLQTKVSRDDIIRASDGAFYGTAEAY